MSVATCGSGRRKLRRLAVHVTGAQRGQVRVARRRVLRELLIDPALDGAGVTVEHPLHETERPEVLAAPGIALAQAIGRGRLERVLRNVDFDDLITVEHAARARILLVARLREIAAREAVDVQNDQRAVCQQRQIDLQCRGVERDQHVGRVASRRDRPRAEVDLVSRHAECSARRRPDFGRKVGERREVVAGKRSGCHELRAHELDAVAGVAGKPNYYRLRVHAPSVTHPSTRDATRASSTVALPSTRSRPAGIAPRRHVFGGVPSCSAEPSSRPGHVRRLRTAGRSRPRSKMSGYYSRPPEDSGNSNA